MSILPNKLQEILYEDIYTRDDTESVLNSLKRLKVSASEVFVQFYQKYSGPFWEETLGVELLDVVDDIHNIEKYTQICRKEYNFPEKYLILTELSAGEVLALDSETDKVYRVNFEGGDKLLLEGNLDADWNSFYDFLKEYFNC